MLGGCGLVSGFSWQGGVSGDQLLSGPPRVGVQPPVSPTVPEWFCLLHGPAKRFWLHRVNKFRVDFGKIAFQGS